MPFSIAFLYSYLLCNPPLPSIVTHLCIILWTVEIYSTFLDFFLHSFQAPLSDSLFPSPFLSLFPPCLFLRPQSLQISVFSLSVFYPPPYARLALAAPYFLNLSGSILFESLLGSSNTRSEVLLSSLLSRSSTNLRPNSNSSSSLPSFLTLFRAFFIPAPVAFPLFLSSLLSPSRCLAHVYGSLLRTAFPRYDPAEPRRWRHGKKAALKELHIFYALTATWVVQNGRQ